MTRDSAITTAIDLCIKQDILRTYLESHYSEVTKMLNYEYDAEAERRVLKQEGQQEAIELLVKLLQDGVPLEEAREMARQSLFVGLQNI